MSNDCKPTNVEIKVDKIKTEPDDKNYVCNYETAEKIGKHKNVEIKVDEIKTEPNDKDYVCNYGTTKKKVTFKLENNVKLLETIYKCAFCPEKFDQQLAWIKHERKAHNYGYITMQKAEFFSNY